MEKEITHMFSAVIDALTAIQLELRAHTLATLNTTENIEIINEVFKIQREIDSISQAIRTARESESWKE